MKPTIALIYILFLFPFLANGQGWRIGMSGGAGWGKLNADEVVGANYGKLWRFTGEAGFFIEKELESKIVMSIGLNYTQINSTGLFLVKRPSNAFIIFSSSSPLPTPATLGEDEVDGRNAMTYASIPILFKYGRKYFKWRFGFQTMIKGRSYTDINNQQINLKNARGYDFGPRFGFEMDMSKDSKIYADFFTGLINANSHQNALPRYNRQFLIGLNYYLK